MSEFAPKFPLPAAIWKVSWSTKSVGVAKHAKGNVFISDPFRNELIFLKIPMIQDLGFYSYIDT